VQRKISCLSLYKVDLIGAFLGKVAANPCNERNNQPLKLKESQLGLQTRHIDPMLTLSDRPWLVLYA
jgi:hypothetical protein